MGFDPLELIILCKRQHQPRKWKPRSRQPSELIFPSTPSSIQQLRYSERYFPIHLFSGKRHEIRQRRRKMLRFFQPKFHLYITSLVLPLYLNTILGGAKKLHSLILNPVCGIPNFKSIRKARNLQNIDLMLYTSQITEYPQLFKYLAALRKVKLEVSWDTYNNNETQIINKFFGFVLDLPKLEHLTILLDGGLEYYKTLLFNIHAKKFPSFCIVVLNAFELPNLQKFARNWSSEIDTLYVGPVYPLEDDIDPWERWPPAQKPEKRLEFRKEFNIDDLIEAGPTIKNLEIVNFFSFPRYLKINQSNRLLEFISQTKTLENLKIVFGETFGASNRIYDDFNKKLFQIESLENLKTLAFSIKLVQEVCFQKISPPYGGQMKKLEILFLNVIGQGFDLYNFTEPLKDLLGLEKFNFAYMESKPGLTRKDLDCNFPFEQLKNLKSIRLNCNLPFSKNSQEQLIKSVSQVENLESLKIEGKILEELEGEEGSGFIEDLCGKKNLKVASFSWKETEVKMNRVNGEMVVSSEQKKKG